MKRMAATAWQVTMIFFLPIVSDSFPPTNTPGRAAACIAVRKIPVLSAGQPSLTVKMRVRKGNTKFPMAITSRTAKRAHIDLGSPFSGTCIGILPTLQER